MNKDYLLLEQQAVNSDDFLRIVRMVEKSKCLIGTPSNIRNLYDPNAYKRASLLGGTELRATLDNNIVTQVLFLVNGRKEKGSPLSEEQKIVCGMMCFFICSGIETDPLPALLERPVDSDFRPKEEENYMFTIADHVPPQVYVDLALGKCSDIPEDQYLLAKNQVDNCSQTQESLRRAIYPDEPDIAYKHIYMSLLKSWLLYKEDISQERKLEKYLDWSFSNSLLQGQPTILFIIIFLSDKRYPKMIKKHNSTSSDVIIKSIKNAVWDLYHLTLLEELHNKTGKKHIWFFCTRDKLLLDISEFLFEHPSIEETRGFVSGFYKTAAADAVENYIAEVDKRRADRASHIEIVNENLLSNIENLESEISLILQQL